jgi:hypothetical protein
MFLIWNRTQFSFSSRGRIGRYTGSHSHDDHIHAEFNPQGAAGTLPFYDTIPRPAAATPTSSASSSARRGTPNHPALTIDDGPAAPYLDHEAEASWLIPAGIGAGVIVAGVAAVAIYRKLERN